MSEAKDLIWLLDKECIDFFATMELSLNQEKSS